IEMKNKHNTMNSSSSGKTYIKMQNQLLKADDCACFLVEAIASTSQNIVWKTTVDGQKVFHSKIRRVSIDRFYEMVTGDTEAFLKICLALPDTIKEVLSKTSSNINPPHDTVYEELRAKAADFHEMSEDAAMTMSLYILGFKEYLGFNKFSRSLPR
ncbi:MAG: Eco47II family restriction endonuclease, partial [Alphaproteobacteria bacterium]|nr:Eco47II family restriction endonuclease [Alphaproteobacteria bacterium]